MSEIEESVEVDDVVEAVADDALEEPEYVPSYEYSVKDKTLEFDSRLRDSIKSKEDEDYIRDLYTRADGLESYKTKAADFESQAQSLVGGYQTLQDYRDKGDMRGLQKALGLTDDAILDFASTLLDEDELPEDQKQMLTDNRKLSDELADLRSRISSFESTAANDRVSSEKAELVNMIETGHTDLNQAMSAVGLDMMDEVIRQGTYEFQTTKKEPSLQSVVDRVAARFAHMNKATMPITTEKQVVLPSVRGGNVAPVSEGIQSLDELRKLAAKIAL